MSIDKYQHYLFVVNVKFLHTNSDVKGNKGADASHITTNTV